MAFLQYSGEPTSPVWVLENFLPTGRAGAAVNSRGRANPALFVLLLYPEGDRMLYYALVFLVLGLVASLLGAYGVAAVASQIAWVLFVIGIVLILVHLLTGRRLVR